MPAPPDEVTTPMRRPAILRPSWSTSAKSRSSSIERARTIPYCWQTASYTSLEPTIEAVWLRAARATVSDEPGVTLMMTLPSSRARAAAARNTSGFLIASANMQTTVTCGCSTAYRRTSDTQTSDSFPVLAKNPTLTSIATARFMMYEPNPPLCDTIATGPTCGRVSSGASEKPPTTGR